MDMNAIYQAVTYDPDMGLFTWVAGRKRAGKRADHVHRDGYAYIGICGKKILAHRVAWSFVHGKWVDSSVQIDHVNRNRSDNRMVNLRLATNAQNMTNKGKLSTNTSGVRGVHWHRQKERWMAQIYVLGRNKYLGSFSSLDDAKQARLQAEILYQGDFSDSVSQKLAEGLL